jgi:glycosyltransferase involved in cell wall biosynthesis
VRALGALLEKGRALRNICRDARIDLVHSNGLKAHMIAIAARWLGGRPAIVHVRDIPYTAPEKLVWRFLRYGADTVIVVSRACWPEARLPRNVVVVHNGVAEAAAAPAAAADSADGLTLGFIGRIHPAKGLHLLLRWLRAALDAGQDARLVVRGSFAQESPGYEAEIERLVDELGLRERFRFEGFVSDAAQVYRGLGAVCVPSHVPDPLPRAVMEAMARGLPVLAYPAGGILEMIVDGADGFLVKDAEGFLAAVRALSDPQARARVCAAATRTVKARFSLPAHHARVTEIYAAALGAAALRPRPAGIAAIRT